MKKVLIFGTFDGVHEGHLHMLAQARKLTSDVFLVVSIARDINVKKIKGRFPQIPERSRANLIRKTSLAEQVVLGEKDNYIKGILRIKPDIIALGYDQSAYTENLAKILKDRGLTVVIKRLKPHKPHIYKNSLLRNKTAL